jgi:hypothetical protein
MCAHEIDEWLTIDGKFFRDPHPGVRFQSVDEYDSFARGKS